MKHLLSILFIAALTTPTIAQTYDEDRMHRDLEVAENALKVIISSDSKDYLHLRYNTKDIDADYIKDYGVIFTVAGNTVAKLKIVESAVAKGQKGDKAENEKKIVEVMKNSHDEFIHNSKMFLADYAGVIGQLDESQKISIRKSGSNYSGEGMFLDESFYEYTGKEPKVSTIYGYRSDESAASNELIIEVGVDKINALRNLSKIQVIDYHLLQIR